MNYINPEFYCLAIPNPDGNITRTYFVEEEEKLDRLKQLLNDKEGV